MALKGYLYFAKNPHQSHQLGDIYSLGSDPQNNTRLEASDKVASRHARIEKKDEHFLLRDLRSTQGTFLNGNRIQEAELAEGDMIEIGDEVIYFSFEGHHSPLSPELSSRNSDWQAQLDMLPNIARTEYPVLLLGPSGSGKEVLAEALHKNSKRSHGPFVSVNCNALTETLIESELFGHVKGAFTGAVADRKGAFEAARGGTLFLDEIGDLPYNLQAKLLRALENSEIRPVGSDRNIKTNIRIVAATHQNLMQKIQEGHFRLDLYYRLNVISMQPPALAQRTEDFEDLLYSFSKKMKVAFSHGAILRLKKHSWPGNIRELKNVVARASALFPKQRIQEEFVPLLLDKTSIVHGPIPVAVSNQDVGTMPVIKEIEKQMIIKRLIANRGNQRRTASDLGMPKSTLHDRIRAYNIDVRKFTFLPPEPPAVVAEIPLVAAEASV
jgi:DNA-binding NtrC family response regulator